MNLASLSESLRRLAAELPREELPELAAILEGAKARTFARLVQPAPAVPADGEPLVTAAQLGEELGIAPGWILERARQGQIPCRKLGRWRRFSRAQVERSLAAAEDPSSKMSPLVTAREPHNGKGSGRGATASLPQRRPNGPGT